MITVKFSNGYEMTINEEGGDRLYKMIDSHKPQVWREGADFCLLGNSTPTKTETQCYYFNRNLVYREKCANK